MTLTLGLIGFEQRIHLSARNEARARLAALAGVDLGLQHRQLIFGDLHRAALIQGVPNNRELATTFQGVDKRRADAEKLGSFLDAHPVFLLVHDRIVTGNNASGETNINDTTAIDSTGNIVYTVYTNNDVGSRFEGSN